MTVDAVLAFPRLVQTLSIRDALAEVGYRAIRPQLSLEALSTAMTSAIALEWQQFSWDKRTDGGWGLSLERRSIATPDGATFVYGSATETAAHYVLHELDFWASLNKG